MSFSSGKGLYKGFSLCTSPSSAKLWMNDKPYLYLHVQYYFTDDGRRYKGLLKITTSESEGTAKLFLAIAFLIGFLFRCLFMTSAIIITILNKRTAQKMI